MYLERRVPAGYISKKKTGKLEGRRGFESGSARLWTLLSLEQEMSDAAKRVD